MDTCLIQAGESEDGDMCIHMQAPSSFLPLTGESLFICSKTCSPVQGSPGCVLARFFFLSTELWFMCWRSATILVFLHLLFDGGHMNVGQSQGRKSKDPQLFKQTHSAFLSSPSSCFLMVNSWRDFGRALTSWKIQCCPRVLLPPHEAGLEQTDSWSFWNEAGRVFRQTGVNLIPPEKLRFCI